MKMKNLVLSLTLTTLSGLAMAQVPAMPSTPAMPAEPHTMPATAPATPEPHAMTIPTAPDMLVTASPSAAADTSKAAPVSDALADNHFDKAVSAVGKGDKATAISELKIGIANLKDEVSKNPGSLKDKILGQSSALEKMLPMLQTGSLKGGVLAKVAGLAKLGLLHQRVEGLLGGSGSLTSKLGPLTNNLKGLGGAMSVLGAAGGGGSTLLSGALSGLSKLGQGGPVAAAEPAVKGQISKLLDFVKGGI
jgi:hypothetical protein